MPREWLASVAVLTRASRLRALVLAGVLVLGASACSSTDPAKYPEKALQNFKTACRASNTNLSDDQKTTFCGDVNDNSNTIASDQGKDGCVLYGLRQKYPKFSDFKDFDSKLRDELKKGDKTRDELAALFPDYVKVVNDCTPKGP